jgi:glycerol-3-phosphate acyltransferase PlsY
MDYIFVIFIAYFLGSIPFGLVLTKIFLKKDIRDIGSGNIGATNALRTGNKVVGFSTLILDVVKAVIPVIFIKYNFPEYIYIAALSVFLGHVFPIWLKFKGGKGVATYLGILFSMNIFFGIVFITSWLIVFFISKFSSLSSLIATLCIPIFIFFFNNQGNIIFFLIMFVLIFYTHRENIKRLKNKEETKTKIY